MAKRAGLPMPVPKGARGTWKLQNLAKFTWQSGTLFRQLKWTWVCFSKGWFKIARTYVSVLFFHSGFFLK